MMTTKRMQDLISLTLLAGTLLAGVLVLMGGVLLLTQHGDMLLKTELTAQHTYHFGITELTNMLHYHFAVGLIQLGLLCLVFTQILRVLLLFGFYILSADRIYTLVSLFILIVMIYSSVWQPFYQ